MAKISILTPFYNPGKYFEECLESILNQTYEDWELILVNDFSTDNSNEIAEKYAKIDSGIRLFQNKQKGLIHGLRLALSKSDGEYITRMDADDMMVPHKLETLLNLIHTRGSGFIATGQVKYISETKLGEGYKRYEKWLNEIILNEQHFKHIYKECTIPSPNFLIRKGDLIKCGGFSNDRYPEDYDLAFRMYQNKLTPVGTKEITHLWRDHPTRSTRVQDHYKMAHFTPLKLDYFLQIDYNAKLPLVLWGAGSKGKAIAKMLLEKNIAFNWICDNPKKIGLDIYGVKLKGTNLEGFNKPQVIIAISNPQEITEVAEQLKEQQITFWEFF